MLTRKEEASRLETMRASAESAQLRLSLQEEQAAATASHIEVMALEKQVALLSEQLRTEEDAHRALVLELEKCQDERDEARARENVCRAQMDSILTDLSECREQNRQASELNEHLQTALHNKKTEYNTLRTKCEAEVQIAQQLQEESNALLAEKAAQKASFMNELTRVEKQLAEQHDVQLAEKRRHQEAVNLLEEENALLVKMRSSEKTAYTRLEAEHHSQVLTKH